MAEKPTIFVVDDDAAVRRAIASAGKLMGHAVKQFAGAAEFLATFDSSRPGCLVLDLKMPGMTGIELQQRLVDEGVALPIIVVSGHADVRIAVDVMTRGALTLLEKPFRLEELLAKLRLALEQDEKNREKAKEQAESDAKLAGLTAKEREVLEGIAAGKMNREIAEELGLSLRAVEDRRARLMKKVQARSVAELVQVLKRR